MSRAADVSCVADVGAVLGEGPVWDPRDQALYWVDIKGFEIFRRDEADCIRESTALDQLYVTSAAVGFGPKERTGQPFAGGLFMLGTGCVGLADIPFQG